MTNGLSSRFRPGLIAAVLLIVTFLVGGLAGAAANRVVGAREVAAEATSPGPRFDRSHQGRHAAMWEGLDLTQEQRDAIARIMEERRRQIDAILEPTRPRVRAIVDSTQAEILNLLTPEQRERFEAKRAEMRARRDAAGGDSHDERRRSR